MNYDTSEIMRNAWAAAREIAAVSPGTKARDWLGYTLKETWKQAKKIIADDLPIIPYKYGEKDGGDPISIFVSSSHESGSGTFWLENRGKGQGGQDDLDPNEYNGDWDDSTDYTIDETMMILSNAGALGDGVVWISSIERPVYEKNYNRFILSGGNIDDLM